MLFSALRGLAVFYFIRPELQIAQELGERILSIAQNSQDPSLLIEAHAVLGETFWHQGKFALSLEHVERGYALYDLQQHSDLAFGYTRDPGMQCLCYMSISLWQLGYPDKALERINEMVTLAHELAHPYTLAGALFGAVRCHQFRQEGSAAQESAEAVIALCTKHGFPFHLAAGNLYRGRALAQQGKTQEGIAQIQNALVALRSIGSEIGLPMFYSWLAEAFGKEGQTEEALAMLTEGLDTVDRTGERFYESELHRLKGELTLMQGAHETEAEACFHQAIEVARRQQARSLELRATVSLCCLCQKQGKTEEARQMLQEIYGWFTEGFDTKDLKEAKALLEELS